MLLVPRFHPQWQKLPGSKNLAFKKRRLSIIFVGQSVVALKDSILEKHCPSLIN